MSSHQDHQAETRDFGGVMHWEMGFERVKWSWATLVEHLVFRGAFGAPEGKFRRRYAFRAELPFG
jgi:hypothetical protein